MPIEIIILYFGLSVLAGYLGQDRRIGFWGFIFASIMFTPIISLLFIFFAAPREKPSAPASHFPNDAQ